MLYQFDHRIILNCRLSLVKRQSLIFASPPDLSPINT